MDGIRHKPMYDITGATIAVVGLDPDGFLFAKRAAASGFKTIAFDTDDVKVAQLESLETTLDNRLTLTCDQKELASADVFLIRIPMAEDGDLNEIEAATRIIGSYVREERLVIIESIVFPGVCEHVLLPILEKASGLVRPGSERQQGRLYLAHAPISTDNARVVGASDPESLSRATALYRTLTYDVVPLRSIKEAETVRMLEDSLRDAALALVSEYSIMFDRVGIDIANALKAVQADTVHPRSLSGIATPRTMPSAYYLARSGHEHQIENQFLTAARRIIEYMPSYVASIVSDLLRERKITLRDSTVAVLGLSDEGELEQGIGDRIKAALIKKGVEVRTYDPEVASAGIGLRETLENAHAVVIAGDHPMFRNLHARQFEELGVLVVVDAKNKLDREQFADSTVTYRGIGRG